MHNVRTRSSITDSIEIEKEFFINSKKVNTIKIKYLDVNDELSKFVYDTMRVMRTLD